MLRLLLYGKLTDGMTSQAVFAAFNLMPSLHSHTLVTSLNLCRGMLHRQSPLKAVLPAGQVKHWTLSSSKIWLAPVQVQTFFGALLPFGICCDTPGHVSQLNVAWLQNRLMSVHWHFSSLRYGALAGHGEHVLRILSSSRPRGQTQRSPLMTEPTGQGSQASVRGLYFVPWLQMHFILLKLKTCPAGHAAQVLRAAFHT